MRIFKVTGLTGLLGFAFCVSAIASPIDPTFTTFGTLNGATFNPAGSSGIPNNAVAITTISSSYNNKNYNFTLGLTATPRYDNPVLENDGAGTFWAVSGGDVTRNSSYARWNVGYYISVQPDLANFLGFSLITSPYSVRLYYDKNTAVDNDVMTSFSFPWETQDSQNLGMGVFPVGTFDPNATGEYSFALVLLKDGTELGRSAINVNVNETGKKPLAAVPDGGSSLVLLGIALTGLGSIARFRK
jgi:hypothetical protein